MAISKNSIVLDENSLIDQIYFIRKIKVMLDKDIAELFGVKPIRLREQVKRNLNRFPGHFMFQLSEQEVDMMVSQNAIPSRKYLGGTLPYVFSEHGVLMLANVLKSELAIDVSIRLVEIFVKMREMSYENKEILTKLDRLESKVTAHDKEIQLIFATLKKLLNPPQVPRIRIGFKRKGEE
jgi:phage regulator Rha-like protein